MAGDMGLGGLIKDFIRNGQETQYTNIPGIILAIKGDGSQLLVDVQPSISVLKRDGQVVAESAVLNVPMQMPASSQAGMVFPVNVGDSVLLQFSMRGLERWKYGSGRPEAPSDHRIFDKRDCVATPCIFPVSNSIALNGKHSGDYTVGDTILFNGRINGSSTEIILKKSGDIIVNSKSGKVTVNCEESEVNASTKAVYNTPTFEVNCNAYNITSQSYNVGTVNYSMVATGDAVSTGSFNMDGSFVLNGIAMETHTHGGVETGGGSTGVPQ